MKSNVSNDNDACILIKGDITVTGDPETILPFKYCSPFIKCVRKINETIIDDVVDDDDLVMPIVMSDRN